MLQHYLTQAGVQIEFEQRPLNYNNAILPVVQSLDECRGGVFASSFEFPGRYTCWDIGFYNPPLAISCRGYHVMVEALNLRGQKLLAMLAPLLQQVDYKKELIVSESKAEFTIEPSDEVFSEEHRSLQPSVFSFIREIIKLFKSDVDSYLGLYGSFGYDLVFQFEQLPQKLSRDKNQRDLVLYLPDEIYIVNHRKEEAFIRRYDFSYRGTTTLGLVREGSAQAYQATTKRNAVGDHVPGEYSEVVKRAQQKFKRGDLFEVVTSQTFCEHYDGLPSELFQKMKQVNPSPYGFFINLGMSEYLIGASPEMYVKVNGKRVETCPISGTIKRGVDAIEDAKHIQQLLESEKEASELTMCTDVDRNDKSRICQPGSVKVIGRRQIEMYSRLIHTVDHVEGTLRPEFDAVDAFLTHMWVVTVTGAPKLWAMKFIEENEKSPRGWYAGAVGFFTFDGNLNTGLVLRTIKISQGMASLRVGATLLYDSVPEDEEQETILKASAFLDLLRNNSVAKRSSYQFKQEGLGKRVLLIDHQDSFVHTLANYLRQTGAEVITMRHENALAVLNQQSWDLVVLSPGPGIPQDFDLRHTIAAVLDKAIPLFGVCLGLQGIVEYYGGQLAELDYPVHGKPSLVELKQSNLFNNLPTSMCVGRYHSLYAKTVPDCLQVTASCDGDIVMAVEHKQLPIYAVQFHPETILSMENQVGLQIIHNLMSMLKS